MLQLGFGLKSIWIFLIFLPLKPISFGGFFGIIYETSFYIHKKK